MDRADRKINRVAAQQNILDRPADAVGFERAVHVLEFLPEPELALPIAPEPSQRRAEVVR